jgi:hypothetical protein
MNTTLCEECFPNWRKHEILTIGHPMTPCAVCGRYDGRPSGLRCSLFRNDPRTEPLTPAPTVEGLMALVQKAVLYNDTDKLEGIKAYATRLAAIQAPAEPLSDERIIELAVTHKLGRTMKPLGMRTGDVFVTDQSYRTSELIDFAHAILAEAAVRAQAPSAAASPTSGVIADFQPAEMAVLRAALVAHSHSAHETEENRACAYAMFQVLRQEAGQGEQL